MSDAGGRNPSDAATPHASRTPGLAATLRAFVVVGVLLVAFTEALGALGALGRAALAACWAASALALAGTTLRARRASRGGTRWSQPVPGEAVAAAAVAAVVLGLTLAAALSSPPNNWDSMTYHMSRAAFWAEDHSVRHFATHNLRQLYLPPFAEFALTHVLLLAGSDRFVNLLQWLAFGGSAAAVAAIAGALGASRRAQAVAALFALTLPMGVLQSSSTQNDLVAAWGTLAFVALGLEAERAEGATRWLWAGAALGLGALTKTTAVLYAAPFAAAFVLGAWRSPRRAVARAALLALPALALNLPHGLRNLALSGRWWGAVEFEGKVALNESHAPALLLSNVVRNVALHAGTSDPSERARVEAVVAGIHRAIGVDVSDPRVTWGPGFRVPGASRNDEETGDPLHALLIGAALCALALPRCRDASGRVFVRYAGLAVLSGVVFCVVLKWQPWHSRLHTTAFLLFAPLVAWVVADRAPRAAAPVVCVVLAVAACDVALRNEVRPLLGERSVLSTPRESLYFSARRWLEAPLTGAADVVARAGCARVGLVQPMDYWDYPMFPLLAARAPSPPGIRHVAVTNVSARLEDPGFAPCAVVRSWPDDPPPALDVSGRTYGIAWRRTAVAVYVPANR